MTDTGPATTAAQRLAQLGTQLRDDGLDDRRGAAVRDHVVDTVGLMYAAVELETSRAATGWARDQGGAPVATAVGAPDRLPTAQAAFVNGVLAHSLDYDDTHLPSIVHPSAPVVPAALAAAEAVGASGREVLRGVAFGLEVCCRLGMAGFDPVARRSVYFDHGQHATSICGTLGAAAAAALLLDGPADLVVHAMGIAGSFASGIIEGNRAGGTVKRMHCGWAARAGVTAAELALRGITGPPTVLEGRFGLLEAFLHERDRVDELTDGLGQRFELDRIAFKPYPANHFTHTAIDAAIALREQGVDPRRIAALRLGVATATVRTIGEPIDRKRRPTTGYEAQFSGPFVVAAALLGGGGLGLAFDDFSAERARDPAHRELMDRVEVGAHADADARYPDAFPCVLDVRLDDGSEHHLRVLDNRGGPERPLTDDELATKFRDNAGRTLPSATVARLETLGRSLDEVSPAELTELLSASSR